MGTDTYLLQTDVMGRSGQMLAAGDVESRVQGTSGPGVFSAQMLRRAIAASVIKASPGIRPEQVQPASLDLRLGSRGYRLRSSFLPGNARVQERLKELQVGPELNLENPDGVVIDPGRPYLVELVEKLRLPAEVHARANPRSSTGRLDIFTRVLTDRGSAFDEVAPGYSGPLWLEIYSNTFTVNVRAGLALTQLRLSTADEPLGTSDIEALHKQDGLLFEPGNGHRTAIEHPNIGARGLLVSVGLSAGEHVGWRAKRNTRLLDLGLTAAYDALDFWEPVVAEEQGRLVLHPGDFHLLISREYVRIPSTVAAEMVAYDPTNGELRTHYAGFFDPGFGVGPEIEGTRAVLEVRAHDVPFLLEDGQPIARLAYEWMAEPPELLYGSEGLASHFQQQGISLSRQFRPVSGAFSFRVINT